MTTRTPPADLPEVQRLMGQCILALQDFECLLKTILKRHHVTASVGTDGLTTPVNDPDRKTLGNLVIQMLGSVLTDAGDTTPSHPSVTDAPFTFRVHVELAPDDFAQTSADLKAFVALRNDLVHGFAEKHDLTTPLGCMAAKAALIAASDRIVQARANLDTLAADMDQTISRAAQIMPPIVRDLLVNGRVPWPYTTIVHALQTAASELAIDGWTPVKTAVEWVATHYPDEQPDGYGCRTWRQVIDLSGLFDLRTLQTGGQRNAFYRPKRAKD